MGNQKRIEEERKPRILCLHGFRTSGEIIKKQVTTKWPESVINKLDLVYDFTEYRNFDECLEYIQDIMLKQGPFDGLLGFSQGAILSAALPGLQSKGLALTKVPKIKFLIIIGGAMFRSPIAENAYTPSSPVQCPSLHFLGETDFLRPHGEKLLELCVDPVVIHHPRGHTIPRFDEKGLEMMFQFIDKIHRSINDTSSVPEQVIEEEEAVYM
ncbi:hypothetical protein MKW92_007789 [Papaver armeniacum]|nr:hypothetical protein MKW92_007789 [Papaver armeniacum]